MNTARVVRSFGSALSLFICGLFGASSTCQAGPAEEPFYHQFIDLKARADYQPTRSFTIITDGEHGNRLVAEDDPDLRFNVMWMDQYQPGYKIRKGGAAFGQIFRTYVRSLYDSYRSNHNNMSFLPSPQGQGGMGYSTNMDYDLRISDDEFKVGFKYSY